MNMPIPPIHETPAELPRRLKAERDAQTQPPFHALSLLQTQQTRPRRQVNRLSWPRRGSQPSVPAEPSPRVVSVIRPSGPGCGRNMAWPWPLKRGIALYATPCGPN
jgi:hypothetical protein